MVLKKIEYRNPSISFYASPLNSINKESIKNPSLSSNIVYMKSPRVLDVKKVDNIDGFNYSL